MNYLVVTTKQWNIDAFHNLSSKLPGSWKIVGDKDELSDELLEKFNPRYIFFPHWNWIVPKRIYEKYECVCFHMADVPYGRGGSPLQNLIVRGHKHTKLTALKMVKELDAGPVYKKIDLPLLGSAQEIFNEISYKVYDLISFIIDNEPEPVTQMGEPVVFSRRTPDQSEIAESTIDLEKLYDHIRMLDADTYPVSYINYGKLRIEFSSAELCSDEIRCSVVIRRSDEE